MPKRLEYHFEPQKGWINDPNGLVYFNGQYHAFFQHYPFSPKWGQMHWGHAVSNDLLHWEELPIALFPDKPYENSGGCYSGSAIEKDGKLYLFYTSVSNELGQTQSVAISDDGMHFKKYINNPVISHFPEDGSADFRDPKVIKINDIFYMVVGSGKSGIGKILLYKSLNLLSWEYVGVLFQSDKYGAVLECPDFFPLGDKYILLFSKMGVDTYSTQFVIGDFSNERFTPKSFQTPEAGPQFYAPQTFIDNKHRRIMIGWLYNWGKELDSGVDYAGALTIPRELKLKDNVLYNYPVDEVVSLLKKTDELVIIEDNKVLIHSEKPLEYIGMINSVEILRDTKTIEVFINGGTSSFSYWFAK